MRIQIYGENGDKILGINADFKMISPKSLISKKSNKKKKSSSTNERAKITKALINVYNC